MTASDSRRHERRIGLLTLTTLAIAVMLAPAQAAAQSVADEKGGGGLRPSEPLRYSDPILLKEAPIDLLVRELEARRAAATPIVLPAPEQPGYGDKGSGKDGGGNGSPPEDGMRSPPPGCACANLTLTIDPGEEVGPFCVPVALDMERLPWCREPGAGELADGADPCTAADDKPILCSLAPMDPGVTHAAAGGDNLLAGFGYGIEGTVSGDVRQCIEGQVVQRSATMLYRLASDPDSIRQIHLLGHSVEQPTDLPAIGNRRHFVVNAGDRIAVLASLWKGRTDRSSAAPEITFRRSGAWAR